MKVDPLKKRRNVPPRPTKMQVRIPYLNTKEQHDPIKACVINAAERMQTDPLWVAMVMSFFFEEIARQVAKGKMVRIPGFGNFGAKTRFRRVTNTHFGNGPICYAAFIPSMVFNYMVKMQVPPALSRETDPMFLLRRKRCYRSNQGGQGDQASTFNKIRRDIQDWSRPQTRVGMVRKVA
jgi:hypothetical protein